jgi:predicted phage terminase large subunit-like protein
MEVTEPQMADLLSANNTDLSLIESNNGGRGFARKVHSLLRTTCHNFRTRIDTFTQSKNKYVRIFSKSAEAQNLVLFPIGWDRKWPKFHSAITSYRKDNKRKSQHDDAVDTLTGCVEMHENRVFTAKPKRRN